MIISDLQYIESVDTNASEVQGAGNSYFSLLFSSPYFSDADADAFAEAFGQFTDTSAFSDTVTVPGASQSVSNSSSTSAGGVIAAGYKY